jgi:tRNA G18 (ribose-2'-O)-methylase SpoU
MLSELAGKGFGIHLAQAGGDPYHLNSFGPHAVLVAGNESRGINDDVAALGSTVSIPMRDGVDSLNVVVAASIIMARMVVG